MKYSILLLLCTILTVSCDKYIDSTNIISVNTDIFIKNSVGENLLTPGNPNSIPRESVKLWYKVDGKLIDASTQIQDSCPGNLCFREESGQHWMRVYPLVDPKMESTTAYIQWSENQTDELNFHFTIKNDGNYIVCDKILLNGEVVFPDKAIPGRDRAFWIVKN
jgi:hypothetical protein